MSNEKAASSSRRNFLKATGVLTAGALLSAGGIPRVHAGSSDTIKIATIGCGSRGSGATRQALGADKNVVLWAIADAFEDRGRGGSQAIKRAMQDEESPGKFDVADDRIFVGFDAYKQAMDSLDPGDVVLLTTPPAFRPLHFAYAVEKGLNVFSEKPVAVDIPGLKILKEANKKAIEKGLKVGVGLNNRHYDRTAETIKAIHDGVLGDVIGSYIYRMEPPHGLTRAGRRTPLEVQLRHIFNFNWTSGGFIVDALIHNLDICCWAMNQIPVAAQGQGGRVTRTAKDQLLDHSAVDYRFADGRRMTMYTQTIPGCWHNFEAIVHGTKGSAVLGEGVGNPCIFKDYGATRNRNRREAEWVAPANGNDSYQTEHDRLFKAIREDQPWNEMETGINATFVPIMGRMAVETGQLVTAEAAWNSTLDLCPNIANLSFDGPFPLVPDENGDYPIPKPGSAQI